MVRRNGYKVPVLPIIHTVMVQGFLENMLVLVKTRSSPNPNNAFVFPYTNKVFQERETEWKGLRLIIPSVRVAGTVRLLVWSDTRGCATPPGQGLK